MKLIDSKLEIFAAIEVAAPDLKIFTLESGEKLDLAFIFRHGLVTLLQDNYKSEDIAGFALTLYKQKWDAAFDLFTAANDAMPDIGAASVKITTIKRLYTASRNEIEQVSAFNESDFADKENRDYGDSSDMDETRTETLSDKSIKNFDVSWEYLQKNYIDDILFRDILNLISISVYK